MSLADIIDDLISGIPVLIAGVLVYFASREANKISSRSRHISEAEAKSKLDIVLVNYREQWIQNLRSEMAVVGALAKRYKSLTDEDKVEFEEHVLHMQLLMNSQDDDFADLRAAAYNMRNKALGHKTNPPEFLYKHYTEICQKILKREWERLKSEIESAKNYVENK